MPLLVSRVLGDVVEVFAADDERAVHLRRNNCAGEDTATDRDEACEGAFLVCSRFDVSLPTVHRINAFSQIRAACLLNAYRIDPNPLE